MERFDKIKTKLEERCRLDEPAANFTTYRAGGRAAALARPADTAELAWLLCWCSASGLPVTVLGCGSNVLISDKGLPGVTILTGGLAKVEVSGCLVKAQAGVSWDALALLLCEEGLGGIEKTSGIPGSVGGAVRMNAGAFGQETFDKLVQVEAMDLSGRMSRFLKTELPHGYRSVRGLDGLVVISATFRLEKAPAEGLLAERARILAARAAKQPLDFPSAGSVFKRPPGDYASRLIDAAGLKGLRIGGAMVSPKHAGFIVNAGGATASDIYALICKVRAEVKARTGVKLEPEQVLLGEFAENDVL